MNEDQSTMKMGFNDKFFKIEINLKLSEEAKGNEWQAAKSIILKLHKTMTEEVRDGVLYYCQEE